MESISSITKYFPKLNDTQVGLLEKFYSQICDWNQKVNLISRKETEHIWTRHILHSLSIGLFYSIPHGSKVLDIGTGGGFPGVPLAILFPDSRFDLADSRKNKMIALQAMVNSMNLKNVRVLHERVENLPEKYDFITGRAVTNLPDFLPFCTKLLNKKAKGGVLYLKGELLESGLPDHTLFPLKNKLEDPYFETKILVYFPATSL